MIVGGGGFELGYAIFKNTSVVKCSNVVWVVWGVGGVTYFFNIHPPTVHFSFYTILHFYTVNNCNALGYILKTTRSN